MHNPVWVEQSVVLALHERHLAQFGGKPGLRSQQLLESALNRPKYLFHYSDGEASAALLAAAYMYGLCMNHPFHDGNKRISLVIGHLFLRLNGYLLNINGIEEYSMIMRLAQGKISEAELAEWIATHLSC